MKEQMDNEFDKLFSEKFDSLEVTPSADLWPSIAQNIRPKKKRGIPYLWSISTGIAAVLVLTVLLRDEEKVRLVNKRQDITKPEQSIAGANITVEEPSAQVITLPKAQSGVTDENSYSAKPSKPTVGFAHEKKSIEKVEPVQPLMAQHRLQETETDSVRDVLLAALDVETATQTLALNTAPINSAGDLTLASQQDEEQRGIRNVADLVNFVVDKVDKRERKLLKFNTDDDDNTSLVSLNLGFLKYNKQ